MAAPTDSREATGLISWEISVTYPDPVDMDTLDQRPHNGMLAISSVGVLTEDQLNLKSAYVGSCGDYGVA